MYTIYWTVRGSKSNLSVLQNVHTGSGAHPASCSVGTGVLSRGYSGHDVNLIAILHSVPRLRMLGAISLLPLCASMDKENSTYVCICIYIYYIYNMCVHRCVFFRVLEHGRYHGMCWRFQNFCAIKLSCSGTRHTLKPTGCSNYCEHIHLL
jgi:hypothetical protein